MTEYRTYHYHTLSRQDGAVIDMGINCEDLAQARADARAAARRIFGTDANYILQIHTITETIENGIATDRQQIGVWELNTETGRFVRV